MSGGDRFFHVLMFTILMCAIANVAEKIDSIKTDPVCEHARMALDTVNAQREAKHDR